MQTTFTIITATRNRKEQLCRAFLSLQKQEFTDWEWIIVDDGSDFFYADAIAKQDERIKAFRNQHSLGKGISRNLGIEKATGKWIGFLDDDDELLPACLSSLNKEIVSKNHTQGLYRGNLMIQTERDIYKKATSVITSTDDWVYYLFHITNIFPWVGPSKYVKALKFSTDPVFQDAQFFLTLALDLPILRLPEILGTYNLHDVSETGNTSNIKNPDSLLKAELVALKNLFTVDHPRIKRYKKAGVYSLAQAMRYIHHATAFQAYPFTKTWIKALSEHQSPTVILKLLHFSYLRLEAYLPFLLVARKSIQKRYI